MSDSDNSSYILRYDLLSQTPQYFVGADWYDFVTSGGGGSPAGPDTAIQFNNAGNFGGDPSFAIDIPGQTLQLGLANSLFSIRTPDALSGDDSGGTLTVQPGDGIGAGSGGTLNLYSGNGDGTGPGGNLNINTGEGQSGGNIGVVTGNATTTDYSGGVIHFLTGNGLGAGQAGDIAFVVGGSGATGDGGAVSFTSGTGGATSGSGGNMTFAAGTGGGTGSGGNVILVAGTGQSAPNGNVILKDPTSGDAAILDTSLLTDDRTYSFPDASGILADITVEVGNSTLNITGKNSTDDPTLSINADPATQGSIIFGNLDQTDNWVELDAAPSGLYVAVNKPGGDIEMQPGALGGPTFVLTADGAMALTPLTGAQIIALTPSLGWIVVNSDTNHLEYYNGTTWVSL